MEASGVRPGPDPFPRAEVVHSSERTRITRLFFPGRAVIRKEPLGPDAERRVRHEVAMPPSTIRAVRMISSAGMCPRAASRSPIAPVTRPAGPETAA
jgi:hypothetical protein